MSNETPVTGQDPEPATPATKKNVLPGKQITLAQVAVKAAAAWTNSGLTLLWKTPAAFSSEAASFQASVQNKDSARAQLTPQQKRLGTLDKYFNTGLEPLKGMLMEHFEGKENAQANYGRYGIEKVGSSYRFPTDRASRVESHDRLLESLVTDGLEGRKYGTAYWEAAVIEYKELVATEGDASGSTSEQVGQVQFSVKNIRKVLRALIKLVEANYPDTSEGVLREWGFQKETY